MIYTDLTKKALNISFEAHKNQKDKSGMPYVYHPFHLAEQMDDEYSVCVALLHDVVEDSDISLNDLIEAGFPKEVTDAIALMTHDKGVPYLDYAAKIKKNPIARKVKLADLKHNSDLTRLDVIDDKALDRVNKYKKAIAILNTLKKLEITAGVGSVLRNIILTKSDVTYYYTISPSKAGFEFPSDLFETKSIDITIDDYNELTDRITKLGLFEMEAHVNPDIPCGAMPNHLKYELFDGTVFDWTDYVTPPDTFHKISLLLDYYCEHKRILSDEEMTEILYPKRIVKTLQTIKGFELPCCHIKVPKSYRYCPQCGKKIDNAEECEFEYDIDTTITICSRCGKAMPCEDRFCGSCGNKTRLFM